VGSHRATNKIALKAAIKGKVRKVTNNCCLEAKGKAEKLQTQASEFGDRKSEIDML
jgi:uncharacterized protein YjbJ (UPF0337 family)